MKIYYYKRTLYNQEAGKKDPLFINNFGYYEGINQDISVYRPKGRLDYHLIYVSNGEIKFEGKTLKNGEYCIFVPNMPQVYTYIHTKNARYYWVHFTGNKVNDILQNNLLSPGIHFGNGRKIETDALFVSLAQALIHTDSDSSVYAVSLLYSIFLLLSSPVIQSSFSQAKKHLEDISSRKSINELAKLYHMSPEHFIRSFKAAYGTTPANYKIQHQLSQAKNLLSDTRLTISGIADMCGFSDPYYFSRLFKKHIGTTPSKYRKNIT